MSQAADTSADGHGAIVELNTHDKGPVYLQLIQTQSAQISER